jgi:urate oxidase
VTERFIVGPNRYGKSSVRVFKVHEDTDAVTDVSVGIACVGDFAAVHQRGDNTAVVPTDTMRNTVYALAQDRLGHELERFGRVLAAHFLEFPSIAGVEIEIEERPWRAPASSLHPHAFTPAGVERRLARITAGALGDGIEAGINDLRVLKTTGSSFTGFIRDRFTTLPAAEDRLLATEVSATWRYLGHPDDYTETWHSVRTALFESFADRPSRSAQEQAYQMGKTVLTRHPVIDEISVALPNRHHLPVDLSRFGVEDRGIVFQPVDEPYGDIRVTVQRP